MQRHGDEQPGRHGHPRLCGAVLQGRAWRGAGPPRWCCFPALLCPSPGLCPSLHHCIMPLSPHALLPQIYNDSKLLAVADEEGFVSIVDTSCELPGEMADDWGPNKPRAQWMAHRNAVFDLSWCNVSGGEVGSDCTGPHAAGSEGAWRQAERGHLQPSPPAGAEWPWLCTLAMSNTPAGKAPCPCRMTCAC